MYSEAELDHIRKMRDIFFSTGDRTLITGINPLILRCWEHSYKMGIRVDGPINHPLYEKDINKILTSGNEQIFYDLSIPHLETLRDFLKDEPFYVSLFDSRGYMLWISTSSEFRDDEKRKSLFVGSYRGPEDGYTNLFYLGIMSRKPVRITGPEHSCRFYDDDEGVAAPVFDPDSGVFLGCVGIHGSINNSHSHTLGLAVITADAIAKDLSSYRASLKINLYSRMLDDTLEASNTGVISLDESFHILRMNSEAAKLLGITRPGSSTFPDLLSSDLDIRQIKDSLSKTQMVTRDLTARSGIRLTCEFREYAAQHEIGLEEKQYMISLTDSSTVPKLVGQTIGSNATFTFESILGNSEIMNSVKQSARSIAKYGSTVLISGESGTGKELFAQAIHNASDRAFKPFIAINCGAVPKELIESELFGYEQGSFTGANRGGNPGKFELANGGTLFLDEIGEMPYDMQVALLRVLQNNEITRIGGKRAVPVDVMVIAATNRDLTYEIQNGTFRADLFFRLNMFSLRLPPLAQRREDIPLLANSFLEKYQRKFNKYGISISAPAMAALVSYSWPGNVRELENVIARALVLCQGTSIEEHDLPHDTPVKADFTSMDILAQTEAELIRKLLTDYHYNLTRVAQELHISRPTLYKKLKKYGLYTDR